MSWSCCTTGGGDPVTEYACMLYKALRVAGGPPATLARKEELIGITDGCSM